MRKNLLFILVLFLGFQFACGEKKIIEKEPEKTAEIERDFKAEGKKIAMTTFGVLSGRLQVAMQKGGVPGAISYCNLAAMPLTDSLSKAHNATIKRTTLKPRNPQNAPTDAERIVLDKYETSHKAGEKVKPVVVADKSGNTFYAPIFTNEICLRCHGKIEETLSKENYDHILINYPMDKAVGYVDGDLRGMWSIKFYDKSQK